MPTGLDPGEQEELFVVAPDLTVFTDEPEPVGVLLARDESVLSVVFAPAPPIGFQRTDRC